MGRWILLLKPVHGDVTTPGGFAPALAAEGREDTLQRVRSGAR